jgi:hypothetical protein
MQRRERFLAEMDIPWARLLALIEQQWLVFPRMARAFDVNCVVFKF